LPRPTAVLFDLDGTLIDSIGLILQSARHSFAKNGCDWPSDAAWTAQIGRPLRAVFEDFADSRVSAEDYVAAYREFQVEHHDRMVSCYDDVVDVIARLRAAGHPLGVVTSKTDELAKRGLRVVGLLDQFDVVIGADASVKHKPDPAPVLLALEQLSYAAHEAVFVGDSVYDIQAGNAAGVTTIAALWGPSTRETLAAANPSHIAERVSDLPGLIGAR
jgi:pyrophosphatase PpaX